MVTQEKKVIVDCGDCCLKRMGAELNGRIFLLEQKLKTCKRDLRTALCTAVSHKHYSSVPSSSFVAAIQHHH